MEKHSLLIGGIGDDAHSVGIGLLALGFREAGFFVKSLGIRNSLEQIFREAALFDVIMISNKNGHAELYLEHFYRLLSEFQGRHLAKKLWYLGGSLAVSESDFNVKKRFLGMGFDNVYPKPIAFTAILQDIRRDLERHSIAKRYTQASMDKACERVPLDCSELKTAKIAVAELQTDRLEV